ncbi:MAG: hypothetical protein ACE5HS_09280 [bacterium]
MRPRKRIDIVEIDGRPAKESEFAQVFLDHGFEQDGSKLAPWPSGV